MPVFSNRLLLILLSAGVLLFIPFAAMQVSDQVNWSAFDFVIAAILLFGTGISLEFIVRKFRKNRYRMLICAAVIVALLLVWAELAVGLFGTPLAGS